MKSRRGVSGVALFIFFLWAILLAAPTDSQAQRPSKIPSTAGEFRPLGPVPAVSVSDAQRSWLFGADSGANDGSSTLFRIADVTGTSKGIGETGFVDVTDVAFLPDGRLFGVTFSQLLKIDSQTGTGIPIGSGIGFGGVNALVSDANGVLYAATTSGEFLRINPNTGKGTLVGFYGGGFVSSGDLAFDPEGNLFATVTGGGPSDVLVRVDIITGRASVIGSIGFVDVFGLAFGPDGVLYGSANGDRFKTPTLIRINTKTGVGVAIGNIPNSNGMFGLAANVRISPVIGRLRVTGPENPDCVNEAGLWTFCQHRTGFHRPGGGVQGSDDTYAWDINLLNNEDQGKPVFAIAPGKVVKYAGVVAPQGNDSGAVLVEHSPDGSPCDAAPARCWWSGYLHMRDIQVVEGQIVGTNSPLGFISNVSPFPIPDHLHLVIYEGANRSGELRSVDVAFIPRLPISLGLSLNKNTFSPGDRLQVNISVANPGPITVVDVYFGVLAPAQVGPALGCLGGDALVFLADGFTRAVVACLSAAPRDFAPLVRNVSIPAALPGTTIPNLFSFVWTSGFPAGSYVFLMFFTPPAAFEDDHIDSLDVIGIAVDSAMFTP